MPIALHLVMQTLTSQTLTPKTLTQAQIAHLGSEAAVAGDTAMLLISYRAGGEVVDLDDWCIDDGGERAACQRAAQMTIEQAQAACCAAIRAAQAQR